jgi:hypothetical protein
MVSAINRRHVASGQVPAEPDQAFVCFQWLNSQFIGQQGNPSEQRTDYTANKLCLKLSSTVHKQRSDCRASDYDREPNRHLCQGTEQYEGKKSFYV